MAKSIIELKSVSERILHLHSQNGTQLKEIHESHLEAINIGKDIIQSSTESTEGLVQYRNDCIQYQWAEEFKQYAILLRDVKQHAFIERYVENHHLSQSQVHATLDRATDSMLGELDRIMQLTDADPSLTNTWKHQLSPVPKIISQLNMLASHHETIHGSDEKMGDVERDVVFFNTEINQHVSEYSINVEKLQKAVSNVQKVYQNIKENPEPADINTVIKQIESSNENIEKLRRSTTADEWYFEAGHKLNVPVSLNEGNLITKTIDFDTQINDWVEREIIPSIIDMDTQIERLGHIAMTKLVNMKNQLTHISSNPELIPSLNSLGIETALDDILTSTSTTHNNIDGIQSGLRSKLDTTLNIASVFDLNKYFLTKSPRTIITEYTKGGNELLNKLPIQSAKNWISGMFDKYISGGNEDVVTSRDQISLVNFIKQRSLGEVDKYYHSLFYSKGFLGQTFFKDRAGFTTKFDASFGNWMEGYPGSMLVYGRKLSGKSTLLQAIAYQSHQYHVINLKPNHVVTYKGQKIQIGATINEAFKSLEKHTSADKVLLIIDDLESWGESKSQFLSEVNTLVQYMKRNARRYFFLVATNNIMKADLDNFIQFTSAFISTYDTSMMTSESISEIISVRERASQKTDNETYSEEKLSILANEATKVAKRSDHNIGVSLIDWANNQDRSRSEEKTPRVFKLLVEDHQDILRYVLKWGCMSEGEISKFKNPKVAKQMSRSIRELISLKVLSKGIDRELTIPDSLIDEVENGLESQSLLTREHYG